ncbi:MAG: hypothetical protein ACP5P1_13865 [Acidimicrobiales bacterium]
MRAPDAAVRLADDLDRLLVPLVVVVGAVAVALPEAGRAADHSGLIDPTLAVLVLTAGFSIETGQLGRLRTRWVRVVVALAATTALLPLFAWALSRAASGGVRQAILAAGVAPSEVASISLTGLAGGEIAVAAALLVASSVITVLTAGPILALLAHTPNLHPTGLLVTLVTVVAAPLAAGGSLRPLFKRVEAAGDFVRILGGVTLLVLLWEVASQVRLEVSYLLAAGLLAGYLLGAASIGAIVTHGLDHAGKPGLLLPVAMRDFAVAAGVAAAAFGPASTGSLGIYGLLVLLFGALAARWAARAPKPHQT